MILQRGWTKDLLIAWRCFPARSCHVRDGFAIQAKNAPITV